jgi:5-methylcytosine-specific restriction endonuclease McrA
MKKERKQSVSNFDDAPDRDDFPEWFLEGKRSLKGHCLWCGRELKNRRRATCEAEEGQYRSDCEWHWIRYNPAYSQNVTSVRKTVHRNNLFMCNGCGKRLSRFTPSGLECPSYCGQVDHIEALVNGGEDSFSNFQLLCENCHKEKTKIDINKSNVKTQRIKR